MMQRNSTTIFIPSPSGNPDAPCITPVPWVNNVPNFSAFTEPTLSILQSAYEANQNDIEVILDPVSISFPDWQALTDHILGGALYPIYERLTAAQFVAYNPLLTPEENGTILANANNIAVAAGKLDQSVQVTRIEGAVFASFQLLVTTSNYTFTQEEKDLWNPLVTSLNFSPLVYLP